MPLTVQPFAENRQLDTLRKQISTNVGFPERVGSIAGGAALVIAGLAQRSIGGLLLALVGGAFVHRGSTGHCAMYEKLGVDTSEEPGESGVPGNKGINVTKTVMVDRPPSEVYRYWRKLANLSLFMDHVKEVQETGGGRSHWVVKGPAGTTVEWDAEIISEREGEMISWQSLPGADVQNAGSVWFSPARGGASTQVKVSLQYQPPAGVVGAVVAKLFGEAPEQQLTDDLSRFKEQLEAAAGQS